MVSYSSTVSISRPANQIFPYLLETTKECLPSDLGSGSKLNVSFGLGRLKAVIGLQISTAEFGRKLAFKSCSGPISWKGEYNLEEDGNGMTTVSQQGQFKFKGRWRFVQPIAGGQIKRGEVRELQRLKQVLEATPVAALPAAATA